MTLVDEKENLLEELYKKDQLINNLGNELEQINDYKKDSEEFRIRVNKLNINFVKLFLNSEQQTSRGK